MRKLRYRLTALILSLAMLLSLPVTAIVASVNTPMIAMAEDSHGSTEGETEGETTGDNTGEDTSGNGTEGGDSTVSGGDTTDGDNTDGDGEDKEDPTPDSPAPECICTVKCTNRQVDDTCEVCKENYNNCSYITPNVKIDITTPDGWHRSRVNVSFKIEDIALSGNFIIESVKARIGQSGSWVDVTDTMKMEISENCSVYVLVTDSKGFTYERNRRVECFDYTKPTLNAAVSEGLLTVQAEDTQSGIDKIYVNGYEFGDIQNGTLNIRLQQFDASYENFTIKAVDKAGNVSDVYKTKNPYYKDPENEDDEDKSKELPVNANPTDNTSATATVTQHTETDSNGNTVSETNRTAEEQKRESMRQADEEEAAISGESEDSGEDEEKSNKGKSFYTIQTANEKTFYLIIDRDGDDEMVYFLTEISENDLLNVTTDNSETLPRNSAALESAIPVKDKEPEDDDTVTVGRVEDTEGDEETEEEPEIEEPEPVKNNNMIPIIAVVAIAGIGIAAYFKVFRKKKEDFLDEDEDEDAEEEEEVFEPDVEEEGKSEDDAFLDGGDTYETDSVDDEDDDEDTGEYDGISEDEEDE